MRYHEIINEIKMSTSSLSKSVSNLNPLIGIEYEFVFVNKEQKNLNISVFGLQQIEKYFEDTYNLDEFRRDYNQWLKNTFNEYYPEFIKSFGDYAYEYIQYKSEDDYIEPKVIENLDQYSKVIEKIGPANVWDDTTFELSKTDKNRILDLYDSTKKYYESRIEDRFFNDFLEQNNIKTMRDIRDKYELDVTGFDTDDLITSLKNKFNAFVNPVNPYKFTIDASVYTQTGRAPKSELGELGAEVISPPQSLKQTLTDLSKIREFIKANGYTNTSTGLHINVSLPNFSKENLDYVKLILLTGDSYVLSKFDRMIAYYAKGTEAALRQKIKTNYIDILDTLDVLKKQLNQNAHNMFTSLFKFEKEISISFRENRIEFRGPGGNWVENITPEFLENTIMRFIVALDAALDPNKYQREYIKKLYKLFSKTKSNDYSNISTLFSLYFSGAISRDMLQKKLIQAKAKKKKFDEFLDSIDISELK
jgi:hypothetical protein